MTNDELRALIEWESNVIVHENGNAGYRGAFAWNPNLRAALRELLAIREAPPGALVEAIEAACHAAFADGKGEAAPAESYMHHALDLARSLEARVAELESKQRVPYESFTVWPKP